MLGFSSGVLGFIIWLCWTFYGSLVIFYSASSMLSIFGVFSKYMGSQLHQLCFLLVGVLKHTRATQQVLLEARCLGT